MAVMAGRSASIVGLISSADMATTIASPQRHCERSEAIQKCRRGRDLDCFVAAAPRNDVVEAGRPPTNKNPGLAAGARVVLSRTCALSRAGRAAAAAA